MHEGGQAEMLWRPALANRRRQGAGARQQHHLRHAFIDLLLEPVLVVVIRHAVLEVTKDLRSFHGRLSVHRVAEQSESESGRRRRSLSWFSL